MHWVMATTPDGKKTPINLAAIPSMDRGKLDDGKGVTILFLGGMCISVGGEISYARTLVLESPEELFALPKVQVGPVANGKVDEVRSYRMPGGTDPLSKKSASARK